MENSLDCQSAAAAARNGGDYKVKIVEEVSRKARKVRKGRNKKNMAPAGSKSK